MTLYVRDGDTLGAETFVTIRLFYRFTPAAECKQWLLLDRENELEISLCNLAVGAQVTRC